jgi:group I intron endonuclease
MFLDNTKPGKFVYEDLEFEFEPFYIGKGSNNRINDSFKEGNYYNHKTYKSNKINFILKNGGDVIKYKIYDHLTNEESCELEIETIRKIGRKDLNFGPLTNLTDGGDGWSNSIHTKETKEYLRQINIGENNPMYGKTHTEKVREEHSLRVSGMNHPMFGKKHDPDTIQKIKDKRNAVVNQEEISRKSAEFNSKKVLQFTLDGEFIKEFNSIKEASNELDLSESLIGKTCRGVVKNPKKFLFKFKEEKDKVLNNSFEIKEGDIYLDYILLKRNKQTVIVENLIGEKLTLRKKDYPYFWNKKKLNDK